MWLRPIRYAVSPLDPRFYGGRQLGKLVCRRKGAGSSADWFSFYNRCRRAFNNLHVAILPVESAPLLWWGSSAAQRDGRRGKPLPYGFPEMTLELGRGAPWVSRRGIRIRPAGGPVCRPYGVRGTSMAGG